MNYRRRRRISGWACNALLAVFLVITFYPFFWLLTTSLKQQVDAFSIPPTWIFVPTLENFAGVLEPVFLKSYWNNLVVSSLCTFVSLLLGIPASYSLVRSRFRGKAFMGTWILLTRMVPRVVFVIPLYLLFRNLGLIDTYTGLVIAYLTITLPFVIWILTGFFQGVPQELEEAAMIDGCSRVGTLLRVVLPLSTPGLATAAIFSLMMSWNQFFYPIILGGRDTMTAPAVVASMVSFEGPNWGHMAAAGLLVVGPVLIFTFLAQGGLVRGLLGGALKR